MGLGLDKKCRPCLNIVSKECVKQKGTVKKGKCVDYKDIKGEPWRHSQIVSNSEGKGMPIQTVPWYSTAMSTIRKLM